MPWIRGFIAVVVGVLVGSAVNMGLIVLGGSVIPAPAGVDVTDATSIAEHAHLFQPMHFLFPFLAHAIGTFAGALAAGFLAPVHKMRFCLSVSALFLVGGIVNAFMIPAPAWFIAIDLVFAYLLMGWVAGRFCAPSSRSQGAHKVH